MVTDSASGRVMIIIIAAAAVLSGWWLGRKNNRPFQNLFPGTYFRWGLILLASGLSVYAYFLRPYFEPTLYYTSWVTGVTFPVMEARTGSGWGGI